jgi:hypothetical protein
MFSAIGIGISAIMNDVIGIGGLSAFGWGVWGYDQRLAFVLVGIILMMVAYKGAKQ